MYFLDLALTMSVAILAWWCFRLHGRIDRLENVMHSQAKLNAALIARTATDQAPAT